MLKESENRKKKHNYLSETTDQKYYFTTDQKNLSIGFFENNEIQEQFQNAANIYVKSYLKNI